MCQLNSTPLHSRPGVAIGRESTTASCCPRPQAPAPPSTATTQRGCRSPFFSRWACRRTVCTCAKE
eukprot:7846589-Pyramimonas_sp.AAC.1